MMNRTMLPAILLGLLTAPACSGDGNPGAPHPDSGPPGPDSTSDALAPRTLKVVSGKTTLKILTSPLTLTLERDGEVLSTVTSPVGVGRVKAYDKTRFYDAAETRLHIQASGAGKISIM